MLENFGRWAAGFFLACLGVLALTASSALFWAIWPKGWREEGTAAWVQAVGSIAAVLIAIVVAAFQVSRQERFARRRDERTVSAIIALGEHAHGLIAMAHEHHGDADQAWIFQRKLYDPDQWRDAIASLASIPLHELQSPKLVVGIQRLTRQLRLMFLAIEPPEGFQPWTNFKQAEYLEDRFDHATWAMETIREGARDAIR